MPFRAPALSLAAALALGPGPAAANPVETACLASGRATSVELCTCIGAAALLTLGPNDQRRAARLFEDPQAAQDLRTSNRRRDTEFWDRYTGFGTTAEELCG